MKPARVAARNDGRCLFVVERQFEFAGEYVAGAARNDSQTRVTAGESLDGFVNRSVATRDDHINAAVASRARRDLSRFAGRAGEFKIDFEA